MPSKSASSLSSYVLSLLRIVSGFLFALHGFQKVFGAFGGTMGHGHAQLFKLPWWSGVLELLGVLICIGLFTRVAAFLLSGEMAVGYFLAHASKGFWPIQNGGELAALYCFVFLYLCAAGPGPLSVDTIARKQV